MIEGSTSCVLSDGLGTFRFLADSDMPIPARSGKMPDHLLCPRVRERRAGCTVTQARRGIQPMVNSKTNRRSRDKKERTERDRNRKTERKFSRQTRYGLMKTRKKEERKKKKKKEKARE